MSVHHLYPLILSRVMGDGGAYPCVQWVRGTRIHPGQATNLLHGTHSIHSGTHTYGQFRVSNWPACLWTVGGNRSARRKPMQTWGEPTPFLL
uniref:Uncharacterized protein n=1 Tax=Anguilla anguilla TaxID=7936 RepID=A0A0E9W4W0_ANGAN